MASASAIHTVPRELLSLIFQYFRLRQLLSVLSFVCKRWRRVVLRLVTRFNLVPASFAMLAQLPSLTHVTLSGGLAPADLLSLPPSITSVACQGYRVQSLGGLALLRLRELRVSTHAVDLVDVLRLSTLESLLLDGYMYERHATALLAAHLPSLSCLRIAAATEALATLSHFATQLTSLTTVGASFSAAASGIPCPAFTRLRRLQLAELSGHPDRTSPWIMRLFSNVPQLTEVHVSGFALPALSPTLYRCLVSLSCELCDWNDATLGTAPHLQLRLKGRRLPTEVCALSARCLQRLTAYELSVDVKVAGGQWLWPLERTPNLQELTVGCTFPLRGELSQRLTALHTLRIECQNAGKRTYEELAAPVCVLMAAAPLRHVCIRLRKGVPRGDPSPLFGVVRALAKQECAVVLEGLTTACAAGVARDAWADIAVQKCKPVK